jgi:hypothetical protein
MISKKKEKNKEYMNFSRACVFIGALHCLGNQCPNFSANKIYSIFVYFFERNICVYFGDYACSERIWSKESNGDWPHPFFIRLWVRSLLISNSLGIAEALVLVVEYFSRLVGIISKGIG